MGKVTGAIRLRLADNASVKAVEGRAAFAYGVVLEGNIVSSESKGNYMLMEGKNLFAEKLAEYGFDRVDINMGNINNFADETALTDIEPEYIYRAAVSVVKAMGAVIS